MASLNANVSGTWKQPKPWVNVSGTWHNATSAWVKVAGTWKQVFASSYVDNITITAAVSGTNTGFSAPSSQGSASPSTLNGGKTLSVAEYGTTGGIKFVLQITGFSSDPGAGWLANAVADLTTYVGTSATYSYSAGLASWSWTSTNHWVGAGSYSLQLTHS